VHTDGIVLAKFSWADPNFRADGVVLFAVPDKGLTYLTGDGAWPNTAVQIVKSNKIYVLVFNMLSNFAGRINIPH